MKSVISASATSSTSARSNIYFTCNHIDKTIDGTEYHFNKASSPGTAQYKQLMERMEAHPTYTLNPISTKKTSSKRTYAGLNSKLIKEYISIQENREELEAEHKALIDEKVGFPTVKSWFLEKYPEFNVSKAEKEIRAYKLKERKAGAIKVKPTTKEKASENNKDNKASVSYLKVSGQG